MHHHTTTTSRRRRGSHLNAVKEDANQQPPQHDDAKCENINCSKRRGGGGIGCPACDEVSFIDVFAASSSMTNRPFRQKSTDRVHYNVVCTSRSRPQQRMYKPSTYLAHSAHVQSVNVCGKQSITLCLTCAHAHATR